MRDNRELQDRHFFDLDEEPMPSSHWAVPWSDLMMIAFVLFAVLYSYVLSHRDLADALQKPSKKTTAKAPMKEPPKVPLFRDPLTETAPAGKPSSASMEELYETLRHTAIVDKLDEVTVALEKDKTIKVSVGELMMFELGRADLKPGAMRFLREFADKIVATKYKIVVEGNTDSFPAHSPAFPTNWELSAMRAVRVARFLIEDGGLEPERFSVVGNSMYKPVVPNTSPANKAKNRRVDILITREKID